MARTHRVRYSEESGAVDWVNPGNHPMAQDFLNRLKQGPVLCDGAMGTLLYAKGVFINKCYDELNLTQPDLIRNIHHEYLNAGADVIETNTFGGNSLRLARHGLADQVREINLNGARLAREAADAFNLKKAASVLVAGSVGPLGIRIEPLGKTSREEARGFFRDQVAALVEGGVDLLILETFGYLEELHQAILAAREAAPQVQLVAQVTIDEDGNCLDGASPETFTAKIDEWGADVIGCNCSVGPVAMLEAIERIRRNTERPLSAQPNAGIPRNVEGRNIYLCSPEYMASYARKFVSAGVGLVGGCCGTTPEHIKEMRNEVRSLQPSRASAIVVEPEAKPRPMEKAKSPSLQFASYCLVAAGEWRCWRSPWGGATRHPTASDLETLKAAHRCALSAPARSRPSLRRPVATDGYSQRHMAKDTLSAFPRCWAGSVTAPSWKALRSTSFGTASPPRLPRWDSPSSLSPACWATPCRASLPATPMFRTGRWLSRQTGYQPGSQTR